MAEVPGDLARLFPTAHDVSPARHVEMQAAFQRHVHAAVSKTVNLPHQATVADVGEIYRLAHRLGCKGVTIYRDQSQSDQVLSFGAMAAPSTQATCPECGASLAQGGGCRVCPACGFSLCEL
jgi:ribonucleoside-diphosphate reductase alpha chain